MPRWQWMLNKEGGQEYGNQMILLRMSPEVYNKYVRHLQRGEPTYDQAVAKGWVDPATEVVQLNRFDDRGEWKVTKVGHIDDLRPGGEAVNWAKKVDSFESPEAREWGKTADFDIGGKNAAPTKERKPAAPVGLQPWEVPLSKVEEEGRKATIASDSDAWLHEAPIGTMRSTWNGVMEILHEVSLDELNPDVLADISYERIMTYAASGKLPPIEAMRNEETGDLDITDGNNRYYAARERGDETIRVWVEELNDEGFVKTHEDYVSEALKAGQKVPEEVLKEYPKLRKRRGK